MPKSAERKMAARGGVARYRALKRGGKLFTCGITREAGPKGGHSVCWPKKKKHESMSAQEIADYLLEGDVV